MKQAHKARLERTNHGCYFSDCSCMWAGGVFLSRSAAHKAWEAHRDGLPGPSPLKPVLLVGPGTGSRIRRG